MFVLFSFVNAQTSGIDSGVSFEIRHLFEGSQEVLSGNVQLLNPSQALEFYSGRDFREAWVSEGRLTCNAYEIRYLIQQSRFDGLIPEEYHLASINRLFELIELAAKENFSVSDMELAQLDVTLSDAFLELGSHLYLGKVDPDHGDYGWELKRKEPKKEVLAMLKRALEGCDVRKSIEALYPGFPMYKRMRISMMEFYEKAKYTPNSWDQLTVVKSIKPYEEHRIIAQVRERLDFWEGISSEPTNDPHRYDSLLVKRVEKYQRQLGLNPDGVLGNATLRALNKRPEDLIKQASVNMERLRWLPDTVVSEVILVNIANFSMDYIKEKDTLLHSKAIVGKAYRKTPVFNAPMTYLVFSPTWTVPPTILRNDVLPAVKKNVGYLKSKKMRILTYGGKEVDPYSIDWRKVTSNSFPYLIRQDPGPTNSLGWVKFMFPNTHNVYIHDTPSRDLFGRDDRALSSGCIRIEKPFELARLLLSDQPFWSDDRIRSSMFGGKEQTVMLRRQIPVVILYLTFWTDSLGNAKIRHDLYDRDEALYKALNPSLAFKTGK
ncbi:L,D-transpeptidase family protein [Lunatimonas salinarum]|uniref:L,D-transpeptidase family protein n=1 Tax=Lunatimonas salinarum TaxID=1774590 RepID=UPI001ADFF8D9|nr:L,D-transpeptidase family protein [Lunatimonas salinarum]